MIAVKVKLPSNDEIRRFSLSSTSTFEELTAKLSQFGINLASGQHKLTYLDDEEDQVRNHAIFPQLSLCSLKLFFLVPSCREFAFLKPELI